MTGECVLSLWLKTLGTVGLATYWVEALNKCFISTPGDTDFDGCVGVADLQRSAGHFWATAKANEQLGRR